MTTATAPLTIEHVPIDTCAPTRPTPDDRGRELESLTRSLQEFGFVQPVLAGRATTWSSAATSGWSPPGGWAGRRCR